MTVKTAPVRLTADDAALRAQYLDEVLGVLYPPPMFTTTGPGVVEYVVVPDRARARLLVPSRPRRVAAAAVRRYAEPQSRGAKLKREAVVAALQTGVAGLLMRDRIRIAGPREASIEAYLERALGRRTAMSIHIGPARANRKPVLQLIEDAGTTCGFVKLGTGPLTRDLVSAETAALHTLAGVPLPRLTVPRVLHAGRWGEHQVLVQSPLPVWRPRASLSPRRLATAMRDVAGCLGYTYGPLTHSPYWKSLTDRLALVADRPEGAQLGRAARLLADRAGQISLRYGAWHGDWAPWNMAALDDTILLWDWERFTPGVPAGFDAIHHELQRRVQSDPDAAGALEATMQRAGELLHPFEVAPGARELTALLYLVDLAARYLIDRQAEAGARLGVLGSWLLPVLIRRVEGNQK